MSIQGDKFTEIADAIRAKKGTSDPIKASDFAVEIASIETGGETLGGEYNIEQIVDGDNCELVVTTANQPENKLAQVISGSVTELTAEDLAGITRIRPYCFSQLLSLKEIEIPNTCTTIEFGAFGNCYLTTMIIPSSVTRIGSSGTTSWASDCVFYNSIATNQVPTKKVYINDINAWCSIDFGGTYYNNPLYFDGTLSDYLNKGLYLNNKLVTVIENLTVTEIKNYAFIRLYKLEKVLLSQSPITSIGIRAFFNCNGITTVELPNSLTLIGGYAFNLCGKLETMKILATNPPTLQSNGIPSTITTIYIPAGTLSAYQSATNWSGFASKFVEMEA